MNQGETKTETQRLREGERTRKTGRGRETDGDKKTGNEKVTGYETGERGSKTFLWFQIPRWPS